MTLTHLVKPGIEPSPEPSDFFFAMNCRRWAATLLWREYSAHQGEGNDSRHKASGYILDVGWAGEG